MWWPKSVCTHLAFSQLLSGQPHVPVCWRGCITLHWLRRGEQLSREKQRRAEEQRMHYSGQSSCSPTHPKAVLSIRDLASAIANMCSFQWWCLLGIIFAFVGKSTKDELLLLQMILLVSLRSIMGVMLKGEDANSVKLGENQVMNGGCHLAKGDLGASSSAAARREKMRLLSIMRGRSRHSLSPWGLGSACQGIRSCSGFSVNDIGGWLVLPLSLRDQSTRINCAAAALVWTPAAEWGGQQPLICSNWVGQLYHLYFHHCICLQLVIICQPRFGKPRTGGLPKRD